MAYKVPPSSSPDDDALTVLSTILSGGRSARFYESDRAAEAARDQRVGGLGESRGPGLFNDRGDGRRRARPSPISKRRSTRRSRR